MQQNTPKKRKEVWGSELGWGTKETNDFDRCSGFLKGGDCKKKQITKKALSLLVASSTKKAETLRFEAY